VKLLSRLNVDLLARVCNDRWFTCVLNVCILYLTVNRAGEIVVRKTKKRRITKSSRFNVADFLWHKYWQTVVVFIRTWTISTIYHQIRLPVFTRSSEVINLNCIYSCHIRFLIF